MSRVGRILTVVSVCASTLLLAAALAASANAAYGLNEFDLGFENEDGSAADLSGSHPYAISTVVGFNQHVDPQFGVLPDGNVKDLIIKLPVGFVGSARAVPRCANGVFLNLQPNGRPPCDDDTAVGASLTQTRSGIFANPVFNLVPSPGSVVKLGFFAFNSPVTIEVGVDQKPPYKVSSGLIDVSQASGVLRGRVQLWGVPAAPSHDPYRGSCLGTGLGSIDPFNEFTSRGVCETDLPETPFLTLARDCPGPLSTTYATDSWQNPGALLADGTPDLSDPNWLTGTDPLAAMTGCAELDFAPTIGVSATNPAAESPSGLDFDLSVSDPGLTDPDGRAGSDIEKAVVTLPKGLTTNPAVAGGLGACTQARYNAERLEFNPATGCPDDAKVGTVEVTTPLLEQHLHGQIYVAKQGDNPFNSLLALYMIIRDEELGVLIKQPLKVEPDPQSGQLTTTVSDIPQLPFSNFHLHFRDGQRAPLITPATCGSYEIGADLTPYADGVAPVHRTASLEVSSGAGGGLCAADPAALPAAAGFTAGTLDSTAGAYSPFVLRLFRPDGSQQLSRISATLPQGLLGKLAGIGYCPEAQIAQAASRDGEGQGASEIAQPSCPASSEVGEVSVLSGAGTEPLQVGGRAYLAGPYKGAPLSLAIITPAIAGPFDLGVVVVRTALQVNPITAQIEALSDPIPTILHGLPLVLRSIEVKMSRPQFTLNPSGCEPKSIAATATTTLGAVTTLAEYFQASRCEALKFKPRLALALKGATRRSGHPALKAVLTYPKKGAYSNIARAQVGLPPTEFLDQGSIRSFCTQPDLKAATCPKESIYGRAKAFSPLLDKPLEGPVYLGVGYGHQLPDLVADLNGQIRVLLNGKVDTTKRKGLRNTFEVVPDAPVSKFVLELQGGPKKGLIENSENLCKKPQRAATRFVAHNGLVHVARIPIRNGCGAKKDSGGGRR